MSLVSTPLELDSWCREYGHHGAIARLISALHKVSDDYKDIQFDNSRSSSSGSRAVHSRGSKSAPVQPVQSLTPTEVLSSFSPKQILTALADVLIRETSNPELYAQVIGRLGGRPMHHDEAWLDQTTAQNDYLQKLYETELGQIRVVNEESKSLLQTGYTQIINLLIEKGEYYDALSEIQKAKEVLWVLTDNLEILNTEKMLHIWLGRLDSIEVPSGLVNIYEENKALGNMSPFRETAYGLALLDRNNIPAAASAFWSGLHCLQSNGSSGNDLGAGGASSDANLSDNSNANKINQLKQILSLKDLIVYTSLCALASWDHNMVETRFNERSEIMSFLSEVPQLKSVMTAYVKAEFDQKFFTELGKMRQSLELDVFLGPRLSTIFQEIHYRIVEAFVSPYCAIKIGSIAEKLGLNNGSSGMMCGPNQSREISPQDFQSMLERVRNPPPPFSNSKSSLRSPNKSRVNATKTEKPLLNSGTSCTGPLKVRQLQNFLDDSQVGPSEKLEDDLVHMIKTNPGMKNYRIDMQKGIFVKADYSSQAGASGSKGKTGNKSDGGDDGGEASAMSAGGGDGGGPYQFRNKEKRRWNAERRTLHADSADRLSDVIRNVTRKAQHLLIQFNMSERNPLRDDR